MESWGLGRVLAQSSDGKLQVRFQGRPDPVLLSASAAATLLVADASATWAEPVARKRATGAPAVKCRVCDRTLRRAFKSPDTRWKSCPECSGRNGDQHVFRPYPDGFGLSPAREESGVVDGTQSWCEACRHEGQHGARLGGASLGPSRLCDSF